MQFKCKVVCISDRLREFGSQLFLKKESLQVTLQKRAKIATPATPTPGVGTTLVCVCVCVCERRGNVAFALGHFRSVKQLNKNQKIT